MTYYFGSTNGSIKMVNDYGDVIDVTEHSRQGEDGAIEVKVCVDAARNLTGWVNIKILNLRGAAQEIRAFPELGREVGLSVTR